MNKLFSVIVPIYNAEKFIDSLFLNISNLDKSKFEICFVDDGSSDSSVELIKKYCESVTNAKLILSEHKGVSAARNRGIEMVSGEYILFLDADDYFLENIFYTLEKNIKETKADIIVFGAKIVNYNSKYVLDDIVPRNIVYKQFETSVFFEKGCRPFVWNCLYKTSMLKKSGIHFDEELSLGEDQLFQFQIFPKASVIEFISDKLYCYNFLKFESAVKSTVENKVDRIKKHIIIVEKIIKHLKNEKIYDECAPQFLMWMYDFFKEDIFRLNRKQFSAIAKSFRLMIKKNIGTIHKMPIRFKKKLCYLSLSYRWIFNIRRIVGK